ncbi:MULTISPECIES: selenocysteine-specific translation elongation factor [Anaerolinea]|uniref:selenocysteine-specific translation elongation factor n=1 Tax=Anaerolinea TaxID=233189 RepID=UPI0026330329|nr:selenocysteine-specific translation elongation factor [Anaerolinea thermophila]
MRVIGTAGHVDHGKSTLVAALTGIHPDRLKEEQEREMTIDLGFAWMTLPSGEAVGIVDVPGHRDFIENMLAGVGGIDAALFVVAVDEGIMPQTREHLAILDLLQIPAGVIALTKADLAPDAEWLEWVRADVQNTLRGTVLENAPIVPVSARTGEGLPHLITALEACLAQQPPRPDLKRPRLPIDRVFTISGFGTIVTGTLLDGSFRVGDEVEILPGGLRGRIRGLQTHKMKEQIAVPGSRTAINISGVNMEEIRRGQVVTHPGTYQPSQVLDVHFRLLPDLELPLRHSSEVKLFLGSSEVIARVRLLGNDVLNPGEEGWLQLVLREPVVTVRGDRYILRRPSPAETLGGGEVLDPHPAKLYRRFDETVLQRLHALREGNPAEIILEAFQRAGIASVRETLTRTRLGAERLAPALQDLFDQKALIGLEEGAYSPECDLLAATQEHWQNECNRLRKEMQAFHARFPLRRGIPREELKSRLKMSARVFNACLRRWLQEGHLREEASFLALPEFQVRFSPQQQTLIAGLMNRFASAPFTPPSVKEAQAEVGEEIYQALVESGRLVQVSPEVVFRKEDYDAMLDWVKRHFQHSPTLTVIEFRDALNTTRKYALGFLEHLDAIGITVREGDFRKLR